jgi:hypothetical protein
MNRRNSTKIVTLLVLSLLACSCSTNENCMNGSCVGSDLDGGTISDSGVLTDGKPTSLSAQSVGAYRQSGSFCSTGSPWNGYGFFLCPGGRIRGAGTMDGATELVCGSYTVTPPSIPDCTDKVGCYAKVHVTAKDTLIEGGQQDVDNNFKFDMMFIPKTTSGVSRLARPAPCSDGTNNYLTIDRIAADVTGDYCVSSACPASGATASCGGDCDCGHCWYCESGTCRYGGEGPYGCYRGCSG